MLERLSRCYGVTLRETIGLALDRAEVALLDALSAEQRRDYYNGKLSLRRNETPQDDDADQHGQVEVDQGQQADAEEHDEHG